MAWDIVLNLLFALLGLLLGAAFNQPLEGWIERGRRRWRWRGGSEEALVVPQQDFRIGPLATSAFLFEGDGTTLIEPDRLTIRVNPVDVEIPAEAQDVLRWRDDIAAQQEERARVNGQPDFWNGLRYAVEEVR